MKIALMLLELAIAAVIVSFLALITQSFLRDVGYGEWDVLVTIAGPAAWILRKGSEFV